MEAPTAKKHCLAFTMFCSIDTLGERFGHHQMHLHVSNGCRSRSRLGGVVESVRGEFEEISSSHLEFNLNFSLAKFTPVVEV